MQKFKRYIQFTLKYAKNWNTVLWRVHQNVQFFLLFQNDSIQRLNWLIGNKFSKKSIHILYFVYSIPSFPTEVPIGKQIWNKRNTNLITSTDISELKLEYLITQFSLLEQSTERVNFKRTQWEMRNISTEVVGGRNFTEKIFLLLFSICPSLRHLNAERNLD